MNKIHKISIRYVFQKMKIGLKKTNYCCICTGKMTLVKMKIALLEKETICCSLKPLFINTFYT